MTSDVSSRASSIRVGLVGPCGAGKSTLARLLSKFAGFFVVMEGVPEDAKSLTPFETQRHFLNERLRRSSGAHGRAIVWDRTTVEDCRVFHRLHLEAGRLSPTDMDALADLAARVDSELGLPSVWVVLTANLRVLRHRIHRSSRPRWILNSLERQLELYGAMELDLPRPAVRMDTSTLSVDELGARASWLAGLVRELESGVRPSPPPFRGVALSLPGAS